MNDKWMPNYIQKLSIFASYRADVTALTSYWKLTPSFFSRPHGKWNVYSSFRQSVYAFNGIVAAKADQTV